MRRGRRGIWKGSKEERVCFHGWRGERVGGNKGSAGGAASAALTRLMFRTDRTQTEPPITWIKDAEIRRVLFFPRVYVRAVKLRTGGHYVQKQVRESTENA